ncbi:MAG: hypothetical protein K6F99_04780 [Lachnospiraceae bacterium]|nr:hypothetical protein [Lachnospiraceae bacterium]
MTYEERKEEEVFSQEVSDEETEGAAGGNFVDDIVDDIKKYATDCVEAFTRDIYEGKFPNCAATVENGSHCFKNDACLATAVRYYKLKYCTKSWE